MERPKPPGKQAVRDWLKSRQLSRQPLPERAQLLRELQQLAERSLPPALPSLQ